MKQFIVDRHTTPNTPTLEQVPTEKIPIYENRAAVTADLANLTVGQIVATKDTGDELSHPVNVVENGNLHAVSSNAVAEAIGTWETVWNDNSSIVQGIETKNGNYLFFNIAGFSGTLTEGQVLATITTESKWKPTRTIRFSVIGYQTNNTRESFNVEYATDGKLYFYPYNVNGSTQVNLLLGSFFAYIN